MADNGRLSGETLRLLSGSRHLSIVFRLVLGGVFIYAGVLKIMEPVAFAEAISNYRFFPVYLVNPIAVWLPWLEVMTGLSLIVGIWLGGSALIVALLTVAFGLLTGMAILRGLDISCGCFSLAGDQKTVQWTHLLENAFLFIMSVQIFLTDCADRSVKNIYRLSR